MSSRFTSPFLAKSPLNQKGKLGRKQRKLGRIEDDIADISNRIMYEKTPDTISQKADRKLKKYFKTKRQIAEIKNN